MNFMKNKVLKTLNENRKAYGGMYFLLISGACSVIMILTLRLSWTSQVIAMADNLAYITSINSTVNCYTYNSDSFSGEGLKIYTDESNGGNGVIAYDPLQDFNNMLKTSGLIQKSEDGVKTYQISWDKVNKKTMIQYGPFVNSLGDKVTPHQQESVIENN